MTTVAVPLHEWTKRTVDAELDVQGRALAAKLTKLERLHVEELRSGVRIRTTSFVGHVQVGPLRISVRPKLPGAPLHRLLRYAYGLRNLELHEAAGQNTAEDSLLELLVHQLAAEVEEILARGLHRTYVRRHEMLVSPRGQIDLQRYTAQGGTAQAALSCIHHPRLDDCPLNQVVLAGLREAADMVVDSHLRLRVLRLAARLAGQVSTLALNPHVLERVRLTLDRRTDAYSPALQIVTLLCENQGLDVADGTVRLPGFLFDMNRFFQNLLGRFLSEYLPLVLTDATVEQEHPLTGMLAYAAGQNPKHRKAPTPRPDFAIFRGGQLVALLDAKYRDLWERPLPREMLYQLSMYALSQGQGSGGTAVILYPTMDPTAIEARIEIREPLRGGVRAYVVLRPVHLLVLDHALREMGTTAHGDGPALAARLALGEREASIRLI